MIKNSNEIKAFDIYKRSTYLPGEKLFELVFYLLCYKTYLLFVVRNRTECPKANTMVFCLRLIISQIYLWHNICSSVGKRNGYETNLDFVFNLYHRSM